VIYGLAEAFLAGPWELDGFLARGTRVLGRRYRWLRHLANRVLKAFEHAGRPRVVRLAEFIRDDKRFKRVREASPVALRFKAWPTPVMAPVAGPPQLWSIPPLTTAGELAAFVDLQANELDWFADCQRRERTAIRESLRHYRYHWVAKRSGSRRLIEAPKPRLKRLQRRVLDGILAHIPPHDAAHGFRSGRSVATFVAPHVGQSIVLKMDLRDFFVSITSAPVVAIYRTAGYPESVALLLAGLCTNSVPLQVFKQAELDPFRAVSDWRVRRLYCQPHLPQGAPTSPALANLVAYRLDLRLAGLARAAQANYTRYADDVLFSGGEAFARSVARFPAHVAAIALEEGFAVQHRKTRVMRQGVRQRAAGIVINRKINLARDEYDQLKAILCNCVRHGPQSQNRAAIPYFRAHLAGRVAYVAQLNPERGRRLARFFEQVVW
jgi:hypothetical protein